MIGRIKRYFKDVKKRCNYQIRYENEIERHRKTIEMLEKANNRIKFLERQLDEDYKMNRILWLQKLIITKNNVIYNLRKDNLKLMKGRKK